MTRNLKRFTIYDMMEQKGIFEENPANVNSRGHDGLPLYKGPVQFPKMVYHPEGAFRVTKQAEAISTPFGPKLVGEEKQLINKIVSDKKEYDAARSAGWHDSPNQALRAGAKLRGEPVPEELNTPFDQERNAKADENEQLRQELAAAQTRLAELELGLQPAAQAKVVTSHK